MPNVLKHVLQIVLLYVMRIVQQDVLFHVLVLKKLSLWQQKLKIRGDTVWQDVIIAPEHVANIVAAVAPVADMIVEAVALLDA